MLETAETQIYLPNVERPGFMHQIKPFILKIKKQAKQKTFYARLHEKLRKYTQYGEKKANPFFVKSQSC
jgi:hypothetical protein